MQAISREVALPLDDIITDATTVLDRYAGHDEDIIARLRHLLYRAREIRGIIHKVGTSIVPQPKRTTSAVATRLGGTRILVVDADEGIRRSAHHLLGVQGATVETARDGHEALALMRQTPYSSCPGRYPAAGPERLRDLSPAARDPTPDADHPDDRLRLRSHALDRQGPAGGPANGPLQAVSSRTPDGSRRAGLADRSSPRPSPAPQSAPTDNAAARSPGAPIASPAEPSPAEPRRPATAELGAGRRRAR